MKLRERRKRRNLICGSSIQLATKLSAMGMSVFSWLVRSWPHCSINVMLTVMSQRRDIARIITDDIRPIRNKYYFQQQLLPLQSSICWNKTKSVENKENIWTKKKPGKSEVLENWKTVKQLVVEWLACPPFNSRVGDTFLGWIW